MPSHAVAVDVAHLLQSLKFGAAELAGARVSIRESREARTAAADAAGHAGSGAEAALRRGTGLYLLGRLRESIAALAAAADSPQTKLVRGRASMEDCDPAGAAVAFGALSGTSAGGAELESDLASARALSGDPEGAKSAAGKIGADRKADMLSAEGMALDAEGRHGEAKTKYEAALEVDSGNARALFHLAHSHDLAGEDDAAIELYRRCAALSPTYVNALMNLGLILEDHDRFPEAEALYRRVLEADPQHEHARLFLKDVLAAQTMFFDEDSERKEDRRNQVLRTPISEFELSVRSRNCLAKMEIKTLGDLITKTEAELLAYKNFGETSLQEIKDILAQKGLRLGMGVGDPGMPLASREDAEAELDAMFGGVDDDDDLDDDEDEEVDGAPKKDPRTLAIEKLELSVRAKRAVDALELETVGDLADRTESELMANKNFGATSLSEIRKKLGILGLTLKGGVAPTEEESEAPDAEEDDGD